MLGSARVRLAGDVGIEFVIELQCQGLTLSLSTLLKTLTLDFLTGLGALRLFLNDWNLCAFSRSS